MPDTSRPSTATSAPRRAFWLASAIFLAALLLGAEAGRSFLHTESVSADPVTTLLTDPAERAARQHDAIGTYATGDQPGDRLVVIAADGQIAFSERGAQPGSGEIRDTYRLARRDPKPRPPSTPAAVGQLCLTTTTSGIVDLLSLDTLIYSRDTYRRTK
ncbi:MAG: hypothetical protein EXS32_09095 [Opitutus sp.]|nr:hypothetical protein [Opitutus sp.]